MTTHIIKKPVAVQKQNVGNWFDSNESSEPNLDFSTGSSSNNQSSSNEPDLTIKASTETNPFARKTGTSTNPFAKKTVTQANTTKTLTTNAQVKTESPVTQSPNTQSPITQNSTNYSPSPEQHTNQVQSHGHLSSFQSEEPTQDQVQQTRPESPLIQETPPINTFSQIKKPEPYKPSVIPKRTVPVNNPNLRKSGANPFTQESPIPEPVTKSYSQPPIETNKVKDPEIQYSWKDDPLRRTPHGSVVTLSNITGLSLIKVMPDSPPKIVNLNQTYLRQEVKNALLFPGPLRTTKKVNQLDRSGDLLNYLHTQMNNTKHSSPAILCHSILKEFAVSKSNNIFDKNLSEFRENSLLSEIHHQVSATDLSQFGDEFSNYYNYYDEFLSNASNSNHQDAQWEDILYKSLFLRNSSFSIDSKNIEFLLNYIKSRFTPGDPLFIISVIKLGYHHELFESPFFQNFPIHVTWPLILYPLLKYHQYVPLPCIKDFLNSLILQLVNDKASEASKEYILMLLAILTGDLDSDVVPHLAQASNHHEYLAILESYNFVLRNNNPNLDKANNLMVHFIPPMMTYAHYLVSLSCFEEAQQYNEHILNLRGHFQGLEKSNKFLNKYRQLRDFITNRYTQIAESQNPQGQTSLFNSATKQEVTEIANHALQKIQNTGKGLFNKVSGTFSNVFGSKQQKEAQQDPEEKASDFYYDKEKKQWVINGQLPAEDPSVINRRQVELDETLPPQGISAYKSAENTSQESNSDFGDMPPIAKAQSSNPFSNVGGTGQKSNGQPGNKKIFQNRYVSQFNS